MRNFRVDAKSISKILTIELFFIFFSSALIDFLHFPSFITYGIDMINLLVFLYFLTSMHGKSIIVSCQYKKIYGLTILLIVICLFTALINYVNPLLVMWGARNLLRYFPFFLLLIIYWDDRDSDKFTKFLLWFQIPNFFIVIYQFHVLGYSQDYLGGIFGFTQGCNSYVNVYMCICVTMIVTKYIKNKISLLFLVYTIISWMYIAALTELKIAFIEIPMIVILAIFINKPSLRNVLITGILVLGLSIGLRFIVQYFPMWEEVFQGIDSLMEVGESTEGGYNISRFSAFEEINFIFFDNSIFYNLFGYGLGNCEYSSFSFLVSDFYKNYGHYNYRWFSHQMWFLQCGYAGVTGILAYMYSLVLWILSNKRRFNDKSEFVPYSLILLILFVINFIYNASLTTEVGYLLFGALAIPFVYFKNRIRVCKSARI